MADRAAAKSAGRQLLVHLDSCSDILDVPWQHATHAGTGDLWTRQYEQRLREHISCLKHERGAVQGTCVELESTHMEYALSTGAASVQDIRKMNVETAVLLQVCYSFIKVLFPGPD